MSPRTAGHPRRLVAYRPKRAQIVVSDQVLLQDLVAIPDEVHAGDFVLTLAKGVQDKATITDEKLKLAADIVIDARAPRTPRK
jgi:hypothetical protein